MLAPGVLAVLALAVPQFAPPQPVAPSEPNVGLATEIEMGDVNGDGIADAVVTRISIPLAPVAHPVGIFLGDGKGGYTNGSPLWQGPPPETVQGRQILIADFNGDHRNDIFVADHGYDADPFPGHQNALALSTPDGHLVDASANLPPESAYSHSAAAADVDGDGDVDIFVGNLAGGDGTPPEILLNDGTGHFTRRIDLLPPELQNTNAYRYTRSLFVDVNEDGAPDLVLGGDSGTDSRVLLNDGRGRFGFGEPLPAKRFDIGISLATTDANGDGKPDLLEGTTRQSPFYDGSFVQLFVGNGDGTFADATAQRLPSEPATTGWPYAIRVADVDRDGRPDIGVTINGNENGLLYLDDGAGVYRQVAFAPANRFWAFADANGDGYPDIVSTQSSSPQPEQHVVQLQTPPVAAPPPVTGLHAARKGRTIVLHWTAVAGATGYEVWRAGRRVAATTTASFTDRGAKHGVTYAYRIRAVDTTGPGAFSAAVRIRA